jgi:twitching motility protein PilT
MTTLDALVRQADALGASDLHLEPGHPPFARVQGALRPLDAPAPTAAALGAEALRLFGEAGFAALEARRSADGAAVLGGVRCRVNALFTARGLGFAVRLLHPFTPTLEALNLHPDLGRLLARPHGLLVVSGPTGAGKSSTVAAFVEEINRARPVHVLTLEEPIEVAFRSKRALVRQREVGRDTPGFAQGLRDALREDPDVMVVGEARDPETLRLVLTAAETGHLVITTLHAGTAAEAVQRIVGSFAPEAQPAVQAALAECLVAVVAQRLVWRPELGLRLPECEVLTATDAVRATLRAGAFARLPSLLQTGAADGMWTFERWRRWLDARDRLFVRGRDAAPALEDAGPTPTDAGPLAPPVAAPPRPAAAPPATRPAPPVARPPAGAPRRAADGVWDLDADADDLHSILKNLK